MSFFMSFAFLPVSKDIQGSLWFPIFCFLLPTLSWDKTLNIRTWKKHFYHDCIRLSILLWWLNESKKSRQSHNSTRKHGTSVQTIFLFIPFLPSLSWSYLFCYSDTFLSFNFGGKASENTAKLYMFMFYDLIN